MVDGPKPDLADMQQPVYAADIDKGAKRAHAAHDTLDHIADGNLLEEIFLHGAAIFALGKHLRHHQPPALGVDLDDLEPHFLADARLELLTALFFGQAARHVEDMRSRHKTMQVVKFNRQAAFVEAADAMRRNLAALQQLLGNQPVALLHGVSHAEQKHAVVFRLLGNDDVDLLPFVQALDKLGIKTR